MLNEATKEDFFDLADMQRDRPERAMLRVQFAMGGGVLNPVVEHVGDLVHRMSERPTFRSAGYQYVKEKVEKTLRWLTKGYLLDFGDATDSFRREFEVNLQNNAKYTKVPVDQLRQKIYAALDAYAAEHDLPAHPLVAQGFPSIGCWPCTSPVEEGQDVRAGRWAGSQKTECGIHTARAPGAAPYVGGDI